jgi:hypothetical protein
MTRMRSHMWSITERSWLTIRKVSPRSSRSGSAGSAPRPARLASSAEVGSSSSRIAAPASARGRWRRAGAGRRKAGADSGSGTRPAGRHRSAPARRGRRVLQAVDRQRLGQGAVDGVARVQSWRRGPGTPSAPARLKSRPARRGQGLAADADGAAADRRQPADRAQDGGLAGSAFADQAEAFARINREG